MNKAPYDPLDVANYIIYKMNMQGKPVTHLKLQKLLYYVVARYMQNYGTSPIGEPIFKWQYGPVVKSVYHHFKIFWNNPIEKPSAYLSNKSNFSGDGRFIIDFVDVDERCKELEKDHGLNSVVQEVITRVGDFTAFDLVKKTHQEPAWKNSELDILKGEELTYSPNELQNAKL